MEGKAFQRFLFFIFVICPVLSLFTGCNPPKDQLCKFNGYYEAGDFDSAGAFAQCKIPNRKNPGGQDLLWSLQLGLVERTLGRYQKSLETFDRCEKMLGHYDTQSRLADGLATTAVNENALPYRGEEYDGVMVNTYKALNFMILGDMDLARVEFNRALDRQRRAKENFNKEIDEVKEEVAKKSKKQPLINSNINSDKMRETLAEKYPNLYAFEAYPDFVNPFATYLAGVYFSSIGEYNRAVDLYKESYGMVSDNQYIAEDLRVTENIFDSGEQPLDTVWVFFENGLGPVREEFRIDLPLFVATSKVLYTGVALPKLQFRNSAYPYLTIEAGGQSYKTSLVANMDRVVQTEFKKDFEVILIRAIVSATAKAAAQYACQDQNSSGAAIAAIAIAAYSFATTAADVRIWTALPKDFQVARFAKPDNGKIRILPPGGVPLNIDLPDCKNAIVYVKIPVKVVPPLYDVITFK
ncbi:MAG: hypothetical protein JW804_05540 [Sedimentisphaerales bacterium]|nr:hypothetical protein [Sedimentisphaerales bacterium]